MKRKISLKHYRKYPPELKLAVCKSREKGLSLRECAKKYKLFCPSCKKPPDSLILGWEKLYKELGPKCFFVNRQGNRSQYGSDGEPTSTNAKKRIKELRTNFISYVFAFRNYRHKYQYLFFTIL